MSSCSDQYLDSHGIRPTAQQSFGHSMIVNYLTNRLLFRPSHPNFIFNDLTSATAVSVFILLSNKYLHCSCQLSSAFGQLPCILTFTFDLFFIHSFTFESVFDNN